MPAFHTPTAFQIVGLLFLLMPGVTWAMLNSHATRSARTVALWCLGGGGVGIGVALLGARASVPAWMTYPLANFMIVLGSLMRIQSLRIDLERRWHTGLTIALSVAAIAVFEFIRQGLRDPVLRLEYILSLYSVLFGYSAFVAWQFGRRFDNRNARWNVGIHALLAVALLLRLVEMLAHGTPNPSGTDSTAGASVIAIAALLVAVISNLAYVGMKFEQLQITLRRAEHAYEGILRTTRDGFFVVDAAGRLLDVNQIYCEMSGFARDDLLRMSIDDLEAAESPTDIAQHLRRIVDTGFDRFETRHRRRNGEVLDVEVSVSPLPERDGRFVAFVRDITMRKLFQEELQRRVVARTNETATARAEAESANAVKKSLMANFSHETRTPMNVILGYAQIGRRTAASKPPEVLAGYFDTIVESATRLHRLLESLLSLAESHSNPHAGLADDEKAHICVEDLVSECVRLMQPIADARGQSIVVEHRSRNPVIVGSEVRLLQVLEHLLSNALRFSPAQTVVEVLVHDCPPTSVWDARDAAHIGIRVSDRGCGVPESEMSAIFEPFYESSRTASGAGGTGLGLAPCKNVVERHSGRLTCENRPEGGAVFEVILPVM